MTDFFYLATPYTKWAGGIDAAFEMACREAARFIRAGIPVFCPIAHSHPIAKNGGIDPLSHEVWLAADAPLMAAAQGLIVVRAKGWEDSYGVTHEIKAFKAAGKPILYVDPVSP